MKNLLSVLAALLISAPALAAPSLESLQAAGEKSFQSLPALKAAFRKGAKVKDSLPGKAAAAPVQAKASQYVQVSGSVNLSGNGYVATTPGYVSINLHGSTNLCDSSGQICSGYTTISTYSNLFVNGNFVSDWVRPYVSVSFYKAGRYVGSAQINGSVSVTGWVNGNWVNVNGYGNLSGSLYVTE